MAVYIGQLKEAVMFVTMHASYMHHKYIHTCMHIVITYLRKDSHTIYRLRHQCRRFMANNLNGFIDN